MAEIGQPRLSRNRPLLDISVLAHHHLSVAYAHAQGCTNRSHRTSGGVGTTLTIPLLYLLYVR